jgi:hypothetical protein
VGEDFGFFFIIGILLTFLFRFFTLGMAPGPGLSAWNSGIVSKEECLYFFHFQNVINVPFCPFSLVTTPGTLKLYVSEENFGFFYYWNVTNVPLFFFVGTSSQLEFSLARAGIFTARFSSL